MKNGMKAGKLAVLLGAFGLMCTLTGCTKAGEKAEGQEDEVIRIEASADENAAQNESGQQSDDGRQEQKDDQKEDMKEETDPETMEQTSDESGQSQDGNELEGNVRSVGEDSMVVSKVYTYTEDGNDVAVAYAEEGADDELITVYFSEDTEYIVRTVKNGGVNGDSDVEDRSGTLSDIREGNSVLMNGSYEGEDFHAEQVIIYNFV
ncbi:MAG: hypothetical protein HFI50_07330 [Lachnospiraceae bacterium]|jgi:hypothetical protein|nr:hypothetical protein [Lachnospiraceae bacterium]